MNILLIFFALPLATIIISIALQKILKCPTLVAAIIFAIFLIVTFIIGNINFLIATIIYTIISYITALLVCIIRRFIENRSNCVSWSPCRERRECDNTRNANELLTISSTCQNNRNGELLTISSNCGNGIENDLLTINSNLNNNGNQNCCCNNNWNDNCDNNCNNNCNCSNARNNGVTARINVIPNNNTNGRSGCICGSFRRR